MPSLPSPCFAVAILAAGASRRMGRPKALLPWGNGTILQHIVTAWQAAGAAQIAVVYDPENLALVNELDRLGISHRIENPSAGGEMISSARAAAAWNQWQPGLENIAVSLIDQPQIPAELIGDLARFSAANPDRICQPEHAGKRGHPVFFPVADFIKLAVTEAISLRDFLRAREEQRLGFSRADASILLDLDTPEDYEKALSRGQAVSFLQHAREVTPP